MRCHAAISLSLGEEQGADKQGRQSDGGLAPEIRNAFSSQESEPAQVQGAAVPEIWHVGVGLRQVPQALSAFLLCRHALGRQAVRRPPRHRQPPVPPLRCCSPRHRQPPAQSTSAVSPPPRVTLNVDPIRGLGAPGQVENGVEPGPNVAGLRVLLTGAFELVDFRSAPPSVPRRAAGRPRPASDSGAGGRARPGRAPSPRQLVGRQQLQGRELLDRSCLA